jgi:excisionase family DNA binding protein
MLAYGNASDEQTNAPEYGSGRDTQRRDKRREPEHDPTGRWLSINDACEILGVDKSTLRRWSDRGRVPVFRTPGGHRRYSEADLKAVLNGELGSKRPVNRRELAALTHEEFRRSCLSGAAEAGWFAGCSDEKRAEIRRLCYQMLELCVRYVSGRGNAERLLGEAQRMAAEYGRHTAQIGLAPSEAVAVFLHFRRPLFDALGRYIEQENLPVRRSSQMVGEMTTYLDAVLTAMMEAYEALSTT